MGLPWDWDNDGVYDESTTTPEVVTHSFSCPSIPCTYPVTLRVTDDNVPARTATYVMNIQITNPPHPPVARANGPYMVSLCPDDTLTLNGSDSYDPDEGEHEAGCDTCPDDTITAWDCDLNGAPWDYTDETGKVIAFDHDYTTYFGTAGKYDIGLRVTDNTALSYPGSGKPNLTDEDFTAVEVYDGCICELSAVVGCQYVTLSWDDIGADKYVISAPANTKVIDGSVHFEQIKAGQTLLSKDSFTVQTDTANPSDPNEGITWKIRYKNQDGKLHILQSVPEFVKK